MKAKFIGDATDESVPETFTAFGVEFPKGKFVDVPADKEVKFAGNSHFEVRGNAESEEGAEAVKDNK